MTMGMTMNQIAVKTVAGGVVLLKENYGRQAHEAAEAHLLLAWDSMREAEDLEEGQEPAATALADSFCGCDTCQVRETLWAATPFLQAGAVRDLMRGGLPDGIVAISEDRP